jgi:hypothetical protein
MIVFIANRPMLFWKIRTMQLIRISQMREGKASKTACKLSRPFEPIEVEN